MSHICHVPSCNTPIRPRILMCLHHWRQVPLHLRQQVYNTYRLGQEIDKKPSIEYIKAAKDAIKSLQDLEVKK